MASLSYPMIVLSVVGTGVDWVYKARPGEYSEVDDLVSTTTLAELPSVVERVQRNGIRGQSIRADKHATMVVVKTVKWGSLLQYLQKAYTLLANAVREGLENRESKDIWSLVRRILTNLKNFVLQFSKDIADKVNSFMDSVKKAGPLSAVGAVAEYIANALKGPLAWVWNFLNGLVANCVHDAKCIIFALLALLPY